MDSHTDSPFNSHQQDTRDPDIVNCLAYKGLISQSDAARIIRLSQEDSASPIALLLSMGWVSEREMAETLSELYRLPLATERDYLKAKIQTGRLPERFIRHHKIITTETEAGELAVIVGDPSDTNALESLRFYFGKMPHVLVGLASSIAEEVANLIGEGGSDQQIGELEETPIEEDVEQLRDLASEAPIIQFVSKVLQKAAEINASDVHIEPFETRLKIRYRVDGILTQEIAPSHLSSAAIISRVKIMASLDIAERRLPQDGRIMIRAEGKSLDIRVSTLPTVHGESVVMRLLDRDSLQLSFDYLGFSDQALNQFLSALKTPNGIILVTGPTGSGKSTTLYTALSLLNKESVKIITVEDPVEYQIEGINQLPVKNSIGLDFARSLRAIMRQDPDIIMIGEMRDTETARIATQAALTGHLVLSTLHTNNASAGITRLVNMGIERYLITSTVTGILAQRLVRKLCPACRAPYTADASTQSLLGIASSDRVEIFRETGCKACNHTGFKGRTMLVEWLPLSDTVRDLILSKNSEQLLQQQAIDEGMTTIFQDGLRKVLAGTTTFSEVLRVTQGDS